jgi:hypothetical protein
VKNVIKGLRLRLFAGHARERKFVLYVTGKIFAKHVRAQTFVPYVIILIFAVAAMEAKF